MLDAFANTIIDGENQNLEDVEGIEESTVGNREQRKLKGMIGGKEIIQLKSNFIPKVLIRLEKLFDRNDVEKIPKVQLHEDEIQDQNI